MNDDDTAATLQQNYDQAVHYFGAESKEAQKAELAALNFFNPNMHREYTSEDAFRRDQI